MRFWDGEKWTAATGPMPKPRQAEPSIPDLAMAGAGAPPGVAAGAGSGAWGTRARAPFQVPQAPRPGSQYGPAAGAGYEYAGSPSLQGSRPHSPLSKKARFGIAAVAAAVAAVAVTTPFVWPSGKTELTKKFEQKLLTASEVSAITGETFVLDTSKNDNSNNNSDSGCMAPVDNLITGKTLGEASQSFVSADHTTFVGEDLSNNTQNASELNLLKRTLQTCHSAPLDGTPATISVLPSPPIAGSDDVLSMQVTEQGNGTTVLLVFNFVRFGDNLVVVTAGGIDESTPMASLTNALTAQAVSQARPIFK